MPAETTDRLEVDYLVIGAGAMGMAFVDTLLAETDATVAIVDRYSQPGGHWTRAYPYVRLHQPSVFYGVNSRELGTGAIDTVGLNAGLHELATSDEILTYFDEVMRKTFLASGRVSYFPMSHYDGPDGDGAERFHSLVSGRSTEVVVRRRVVDATYMNVTVPSMTTPRYAVAAGVRVIPPNDLVTLTERPAHFTVVGSGKTGIDACLWLLQHSVDPADITWVMPRDAWLFDRARIQPGPPSGSMGSSLPAGMDVPPGTSPADLLIAGIEASGLVMRLSPDVTPTAFRCATVTRAELEQLRRIEDVLRHGRVTAIDVDRIEFGDVTVPAQPGTLVRRLHRRRPGTAADRAGVRRLPDDAAGDHPVPAGVQREPGRVRGGVLRRRRAEERAVRSVPAPQLAPRPAEVRPRRRHPDAPVERGPRAPRLDQPGALGGPGAGGGEPADRRGGRVHPARAGRGLSAGQTRKR